MVNYSWNKRLQSVLNSLKIVIHSTEELNENFSKRNLYKYQIFINFGILIFFNALRLGRIISFIRMTTFS